MSIRFRLTLWHTALLGLVLIGFAALVYLAVARQLASQLDYDIQLRALNASRALRAVTRELMRNHLKHCATEAIRKGPEVAEAMYDELATLMHKHAR